MAKYYGAYEISDITPVEGTERSTVLFTTGFRLEMPNKMIAACVKDAAVDATALRDLRVFAVAAEVLKVLFEWDLLINELEPLCQRVIMSVKEADNKGDDIMWGMDYNMRSFHDLEKVLKKGNEAKAADGSVVSPMQPGDIKE